MSETQESKLSVPEKPKGKSLADLDEALSQYPVEVAPDFHVAIRQLTARDLMAFERRFKCTVDAFFFKLVNVISYSQFKTLEQQAFNEEQKAIIAEQIKISGVSYDEDTNTYTTPTGKLEGSVDLNMLNVLAFILSRIGRIVCDDNGEFVKDDDGDYEVRPVTEDMILDNLSGSVLGKVSDDANSTVFWEIMKITRAFVPAEPMAVEEPQDDEAGNSPSEEGEKAPTSKRRKAASKADTNSESES